MVLVAGHLFIKTRLFSPDAMAWEDSCEAMIVNCNLLLQVVFLAAMVVEGRRKNGYAVVMPY